MKIAALGLALTIPFAGCAVSGNAPFAIPASFPLESDEVSIRVEVALGADRQTKRVGADRQAAMAGAARTTFYVGGDSSPGGYNDMNTLIVGLFDEGTTIAPSFGFKYASAWGDVLTSSAVATLSGSAWLASLETLMASVTTADVSATRRYLVREYTSGLGSANSLAASFTKVPRIGAFHAYRAFAAAYDSDGNNLGFTSNLLPSTTTDTDLNATAATLTLTLDTNLYTGTLTQGGTISNVYPEAL